MTGAANECGTSGLDTNHSPAMIRIAGAIVSLALSLCFLDTWRLYLSIVLTSVFLE
jgi:hypothetical protein